jgi:hypothetical protein
MLAAGEIPHRRCFWLDTSTRANFMSAVYAVDAMNITRTIVKLGRNEMVYICSPTRGLLKTCPVCQAAWLCDETGLCAIAVHLLYPQILNDAVPSERKAGIRMGLRVLASVRAVAVRRPAVSHGMSCEIARPGDWVSHPIPCCGADRSEAS